jgi:hypothetical protein
MIGIAYRAICPYKKGIRSHNYILGSYRSASSLQQWTQKKRQSIGEENSYALQRRILSILEIVEACAKVENT